jgi:putative nucleotidyltransferase with HDIG domain
MDEQLKYLVNEVKFLPTLDTIASNVIQFCSDPQTPISKITDLISIDQSLTSQILKIANSNYFNFPKTIISLKQSIVLLGYPLLQDLAISIAIYSFYDSLSINYRSFYRELCRHAVLTGVIGKALAQKYNPSNNHLLYLTGLLHDIGKIVESRVKSEDFFFLCKKSDQENLRLDIIEKRILGYHHGDVGAALLKSWNLPDSLIYAVKHHHEPENFYGDADQLQIVRLTYFSNMLAHYLQKGLRKMSSVFELDPDFSRNFKISEHDFNLLVAYVKNFLKNYRNLNNLFD